ncbi:MAG: pyruvate ferredoxin oxidoreductase [Deltaproteobacteria bacterium HGW-Deltaproteobacteria-15]|nr:MAG: pyruvate ferredoxin oxidoreductase [Deltaproteobacteria bacterium HGW-Deltaproteobacteria-15]
MKKVAMGTESAALAAKLARVQVVSAYPITPQTVIVESLADIIGRGELHAEYIPVESEHTAMASCIGASMVGARAFTASSSQGLAYMHEMLHYAAGARVPVVMANCNRALSPPWNLYCDHTDSLAQRDTGWVQYYCASAQDVLDSILIAYAVAERAFLPVMINLDAFYLTHTSEILDVPDQEEVDAFLPPYRPSIKLDVNDPKTFGNVCGSDLYTSIKYKRHCDTLSMEKVWDQAAAQFEGRFNRPHPSAEAYRTEDAEVCIVSIGTAAGAVRMAVDGLREEGIKAGGLRLGIFRPFPRERFEKAVANVTHVIIIDRDISFGAEGILAQEVKAGLFDLGKRIKITGFVAGVGGNDISVDSTIALVRQAITGDGGAVKAGLTLWAEVLP